MTVSELLAIMALTLLILGGLIHIKLIPAFGGNPSRLSNIVIYSAMMCMAISSVLRLTEKYTPPTEEIDFLHVK